MSVDLLANVERAHDSRPSPAMERADTHAGYWLGSATREAQEWKARALAAERELADLRRALLAGWRPHT